ELEVLLVGDPRGLPGEAHRLVDRQHRPVVDVVPGLDVLDSAIDREAHRTELQRHGDALAARVSAYPGEPLPQERRIVERPEHVRNSEVPTILVDCDEKRVQEGVRRVDVVTPKLLEGVAGRWVN